MRVLSADTDLLGWYAPWRISRLGLAFVVATHLIAFAALLWLQPPAALKPSAVLSVSLFPMAQEHAPEPEAAPQPPRSTARPTLPQPHVVRLAAPAESPAPTTASVAPQPADIVPALQASPVAPSTASSAAPAPAAASQPRFDAEYLDNPKPPYPAISRRLREQGRVVLRVRVDAAGLPLDVQLHAGSGSARLDHSALETVRRWKFVPARLGETAVAATVLVPIAFSLKD